MGDRCLAAIVCGFPPVALLIWAIKYGITWPSWAVAGASLVPAAWIIGVLLVLILIGTYYAGSVGAGAHVHGGKRSAIARHEAGHIVAARALGSRVTTTSVSNSGGYVGWSGTKGTPRQQAVNGIAFLRAGEHANPGLDVSYDNACVAWWQRKVPPSQRAAVRREGDALARRIVRQRSGEIDRTARKLGG